MYLYVFQLVWALLDSGQIYLTPYFINNLQDTMQLPVVLKTDFI